MKKAASRPLVRSSGFRHRHGNKIIKRRVKPFTVATLAGGVTGVLLNYSSHSFELIVNFTCNCREVLYSFLSVSCREFLFFPLCFFLAT